MCQGSSWGESGAKVGSGLVCYKGIVDGGEAHEGLVLGPIDFAHCVDGVAIGVDEPDCIAAIAQSVADASVVYEDGHGETGRCAAAEEHDATGGGYAGVGGEDEPLVQCGVVVTQAPAGQGEGVGSGVEQFDEFVFVSVPLAVLVGIAFQTGGRIGQYFFDEDEGKRLGRWGCG